MGWRVFAIMPLAALLLAGCGGLVAGTGTSTALSRLHASLETRAAAVHALTVRIAAIRDSKSTTAYATAVVKTSNRRVAEALTVSGGRTTTTVDDGTNVWTYQPGGSQYAVQSSMPTTGYDLRWITFDWPTFLQSVRFAHPTKQGAATVLDFRGQLAGQAATGTLTLSHNLEPTRLTLHQGGATVTLKVTDYSTTAPIASSTFRFLPPTGATAVNTTPTVLTALTTDTSTLAYSAVVPTVHAGLALESVRVVKTATYGTELIMQYQDSSGSPVLATEWQAGPPAPYAKSSTTDVVVGGRTVAERDLPGGGVYATVTVSGTTVVVEGQTGAVGATLANLTVAKP
ncbi:MAG: hypothetical protein M0Z54_12545 [Thermaerobacter sp.]|nr:hypothetical protein [Thermaerobacter sp.]